MARFIKHVTLAGATVAPGVQLTKTWRVRNDHPTDSWPSSVEVVQVGGEALTADPQSVRGGVVPGGEQDITVFAFAPQSPGYYECHFRLSCVDTSLKFGQRLTMAITVVGPMTSSSSSDESGSSSSSSSSSDSSSSSESDVDDNDSLSMDPRKTRKLKRKIQKLESKHRAKIFRISNKLDKLYITQHDAAVAEAVALPIADMVHSDNAEAAGKWQAEAEQLSSMGFTNRAWNARLLVKFGGNVERVVQRLLEKRKKQEKKQAKKLHKKDKKCKKKEKKRLKKELLRPV